MYSVLVLFKEVSQHTGVFFGREVQFASEVPCLNTTSVGRGRASKPMIDSLAMFCSSVRSFFLFHFRSGALGCARIKKEDPLFKPVTKSAKWLAYVDGLTPRASAAPPHVKSAAHDIRSVRTLFLSPDKIS